MAMREVRTLTLDRVDVRAEEDSAPVFSGHAAVFNQRALIGSRQYGFIEQIAPGAFEPALDRSDTKFLHNHDPNIMLGSRSSGSLRMEEDKVGLAVENDMPDTSQARDIVVLLERNDINKMSFAFTVAAVEWRVIDDEDDEFNGMEERTITEVDTLYDVSTVAYPAYDGTDAGLRGATEAEVRAVLEAHRATSTKLVEDPGTLISIEKARQKTRSYIL